MLARIFIRKRKLSGLSFNGIKNPNRSKSLTVFLVVCCLAVMLLFRSTARAEQDDDVKKDPFFSAMQMDWGGYLRAIGTVSRVDDQPLYPHADSDPFLDGQVEWRLKNRLSMGPRWTVQTHYELVAFGGDTFEYAADLDRMVPVSLAPFLSFSDAVNDDRRLFDLTVTWSTTDWTGST